MQHPLLPCTIQNKQPTSAPNVYPSPVTFQSTIWTRSTILHLNNPPVGQGPLCKAQASKQPPSPKPDYTSRASSNNSSLPSLQLQATTEKQYSGSTQYPYPSIQTQFTKSRHSKRSTVEVGPHRLSLYFWIPSKDSSIGEPE